MRIYLELGHLADQLDIARFEMAVDMDVALTRPEIEFVRCRRRALLLLAAFIFIHPNIIYTNLKHPPIPTAFPAISRIIPSNQKKASLSLHYPGGGRSARGKGWEVKSGKGNGREGRGGMFVWVWGSVGLG